MTNGLIELQAAFDTAIPALVSDGFMTFVTSTIYREGDTVKSGWITDGYRAYLEWIRMMMEEGVLYEDFLAMENSKLVMNEYCGTGQHRRLDRQCRQDRRNGRLCHGG